MIRHDTIHRPFFLTAMATMLTLGAAWGVLLLWKIGSSGSFTGVSVHEVNTHGQAQIMGWVGLFIMGFAYQAFPHMWNVQLPARRLATFTLAAMVVGIAIRIVAPLSHPAAWAEPMHLAGLALQAMAVTVFITQMFVAFVRSRQALLPYVGFAFASMAFFFTQTLFDGWHMARLLAAPDRAALLEQIATWQAPLRDMQIHGLAMLMIFGVAIRVFPFAFGLPRISDRRAWTALAVLLAAVIMEIALFLTYRWTGNRSYAYAMLLPWLMLPTGAWMVAGPWRLWRAFPGQANGQRAGKFVRIAFAWLFLSFAMLLLLPVYQIVSGIPFSHAYYGAIRHAITVGFISMMIVGMAARFVPMLAGRGADAMPPLWSVFVLLNIGCMLRVTLQIGTDWNPEFFRLIGISGALEWTAMAIWSAHLAAIMLGLGRYRVNARKTRLVETVPLSTSRYTRRLLPQVLMEAK